MILGLLHRAIPPQQLASDLTAPICFSHSLVGTYFPNLPSNLGFAQWYRSHSIQKPVYSVSPHKCHVNLLPPSRFTELCNKNFYRLPRLDRHQQFSTFPQQRRRVEPGTTDRSERLTKHELRNQHQGENGGQEFERSHRAAQASHMNMSSQLSKDGKDTKRGLGEIWRPIQIARPEFKWLILAFVLLAIYSGVTMSVPYSIGQILDVATRGNTGDSRLLGLTIPQFLVGLVGILSFGALANFGAMTMLRVIGERVVARLRSQLYRRIYMQNAEFFDANRVGDLISRLTLDTAIVGKSITQNLSNGMSNLFVSGAGFSIMVWTSSPKLTGLLLLMFPPVAVITVIYGLAVRNVSKAMQKTMGTLTKTAEERLGSVKTSQAFVGEAQEVDRYNKQVRNIFSLGRKEALVNASFYASTGWVGDMATVAILTFGLLSIQAGTLSAGDLTSFMLYTVFTGSGLFGLSSFYSELMKAWVLPVGCLSYRTGNQTYLRQSGCLSSLRTVLSSLTMSTLPTQLDH